MLIIKAWIKCGYTTVEEAAQRYTDGDEKEYNKLAMRSKDGMAKLLCLMEVPKIEEASDDFQNTLDQPHHGEKHRAWAITAEGDPPIYLPRWMKPAIDKRISKYIYIYIHGPSLGT